jgi:hypothetical protein
MYMLKTKADRTNAHQLRFQRIHKCQVKQIPGKVARLKDLVKASSGVHMNGKDESVG